MTEEIKEPLVCERCKMILATEGEVIICKECRGKFCGMCAVLGKDNELYCIICVP